MPVWIRFIDWIVLGIGVAVGADTVLVGIPVVGRDEAGIGPGREREGQQRGDDEQRQQTVGKGADAGAGGRDHCTLPIAEVVTAAELVAGLAVAWLDAC